LKSNVFTLNYGFLYKSQPGSIKLTRKFHPARVENKVQIWIQYATYDPDGSKDNQFQQSK